MAKHSHRRSRELDRHRRRHLARRRARAAAAAGGDLALEQLEVRQLLALTISKDVISSGADIVYTDVESITVDPGVILNAGGGKITLTAPKITIGAGARLLSKGTGAASDGAITLTARDASSRTGLNVADLLVEVLGGFARETATISIGERATIDGGTIRIDAFAGNDKASFSNDPLTAVASKVPSVLMTALNDIVNLPVSVSVKRPTATIDVQADARIAGSGDVTIQGTATARAQGRAVWSVLAEGLKTAKERYLGVGLYEGREQPTNDSLFKKLSFAIGVGFGKADATSTVGAGADIVSSGGAVTIRTDVTNTVKMDARTYLNQGVGPTNRDNYSFALAFSRQETVSKIDVKQGASVEANKNVDIRAKAIDSNFSRASTASYYDGRVGAVASLAFGWSDVLVTIDGTVKAGRVELAPTLTFNPSLTVDFATSTLVFAAPHGFTTGAELRYDTAGGDPIPGLASGVDYYAIVDPAAPTRLRLAETRDDASMTSPASN